MNTSLRGLLYLVIGIAVIALVCVWPAFFLLPQVGAGVALPVIVLPAEVLQGNLLPSFFGYDVTNTFTSMILVDIILLVIGFVVYRATRVSAPDRFVPRGFTNFMELVTEFLYNQGRPLVGENTRKVFPVAGTIFLMLLVANLVKLVPGFESVGQLACAEPNQTYYNIHKPYGSGGAYFYLNNALDISDRSGTRANEDDTHACEEKYPRLTPPIVLAKQARGTYTETKGPEENTESEGDHSEEGTPESGEQPADATGEANPAEGETAPDPTQSSSINPMSYRGVDSTVAKAETGNPEAFVVIPWFRAYATDLNLPLALSLIVVVMVQFWGVSALGPSYFFKFINLPALGNLGKKPLGAIDFIVGLIEIVSELSRLVSLTFRLFGNIFAGGILVIVLSFLMGFLLPVPFYLLEVFVGAVQAYVFALLTFIYAGQAMTGHHGDDDHAEAHH